MAIYDRWHRSHPPEGTKPCRCGRGRNKLYPTAEHGKGKRWQVRWDTVDDDGKRHQPKKNFDELEGDDPARHAKAWNAKVNADLDADRYIDPQAGKVTLETYAKQWRAGQTADPSSLETIDKRLAHIVEVERTERTRRAPGGSVIAGQPMAVLAKRPSLLQQWVRGLQKKGLSARYIKQIFDTLSSVFIAAMDDGVVAANPCRAKSIRLPTVDQAVIVPWTPEMVAAARTDLEARKGCGAMVDLGAGAGMRQGEIFAFAEEDIVFLGRKADRKVMIRRQVKRVDGQLVFAPPKGGKEREAPLSDALARALAAHIKKHPPRSVTLPWKTPDSKRTVTVRLLFVRTDGMPWHRGTFEYSWARARDAAGAEATQENGMHILRHTFASVCLHNGVDVIKLAVWLGHADPGFTLRIYGHFIPDVADRGRAAVDTLLEPPGDRRSALDVPSDAGQ